MNGDLVYHEVDGLAIADIKPVNVKNHRIGLRVAKFTRDGKYIVTYASTKDAANALTKVPSWNIRQVCIRNRNHSSGHHSYHGVIYKFEADVIKNRTSKNIL